MFRYATVDKLGLVIVCWLQERPKVLSCAKVTAYYLPIYRPEFQA